MMGTNDGEAQFVVESIPEHQNGVADFMGMSDQKLAKDMQAREQLQHSVNIGKSFAVSEFMITRMQFSAFVHATGYTTDKCMLWTAPRITYLNKNGWDRPGFDQGDQEPVVCVSLNDAHAYVNWINVTIKNDRQNGISAPYRLLSESELEYVTRAGSGAIRWWGNAFRLNMAKCKDCGAFDDIHQTVPVGQFAANAFGVFDALGNVWERTEDCSFPSHVGAPADGSARDSGDCAKRVIKGGSWDSARWVLRSAVRAMSYAEHGSNNIGFRVAVAIQ